MRMSLGKLVPVGCSSAVHQYLQPSARTSPRALASGPRVMTSSRGAFIVFEGIDRCGKSTQSALLVEKLKQQNIPAELWRFPDRMCSVTGSLINSYLTKEIELNDQAVHLLFSANRWQKKDVIEEKLKEGVTLVVDRYAYSGAAYSAAKNRPHMSLEWCKACDSGLPAPDRVLYMQLSPEASAKRGGFGGERYEKQAFQTKVAEMFGQFQEPNWRVVDADQPVEAVHEQVWAEATAALSEASQPGCPIPRLWTHDIVVTAAASDMAAPSMPMVDNAPAGTAGKAHDVISKAQTISASCAAVERDSTVTTDQQCKT